MSNIKKYKVGDKVLVRSKKEIIVRGKHNQMVSYWPRATAGFVVATVIGTRAPDLFDQVFVVPDYPGFGIHKVALYSVSLRVIDNVSDRVVLQ